ncbi:MAG: RNA polymerase sigma factor [Planctomycetes bacterium]|nr:RNA polymerase sigma factor [Planctomycetota bacterium]
MDDRLDETLVCACKQGDTDAYAVLVKRHYRHVFALCLGVLGNVHDAEDIAQDAMLKGLVKIKKLGRGEQFEAWILQIAKNLSIDFLRRRRRVKPLAGEQLMQAGQRSQENHELEQAVRRLPGELRIPLVMYYFDKKNAKTIAEELNISHSGACQKIRTARKELHKLLTERGQDEQRM